MHSWSCIVQHWVWGQIQANRSLIIWFASVIWELIYIYYLFTMNGLITLHEQERFLMNTHSQGQEVVEQSSAWNWGSELPFTQSAVRRWGPSWRAFDRWIDHKLNPSPHDRLSSFAFSLKHDPWERGRERGQGFGRYPSITNIVLPAHCPSPCPPLSYRIHLTQGGGYGVSLWNLRWDQTGRRHWIGQPRCQKGPLMEV